VEGMLYDYPKEIKEIFLDKVSIIINEEK